MKWSRLEFSDHFPDLPVKWFKSMHNPEMGQARFSQCVKKGQASKHSLERIMRQNAVYTIPWIVLERKCSQRGAHTACVGEGGIQHQLFGGKVVFATEIMSSCLHGNRTWGAGWFSRTGADFGNQERNDIELVDSEGSQPGGQGSHWQTHLPLPEKRSFLLGRSARKILLKWRFALGQLPENYLIKRKNIMQLSC